jgi:hypothetical protein
MDKKTSPAFPFVCGANDNVPDTWVETGLTKRELLAGMAMKGLLANPNGAMQANNRRTFAPEELSEVAVKHADALIEKLNE